MQSRQVTSGLMLSDLLLNTLTILIIDEKFTRRSRNDPARKLSLFKGV